MPSASAIQEKAYQRRWWILGVLCFSLLVIVLDNTILNVAIPTLVRDLDATNSQLQWMVDAYTLVFAGLLLTAGSLGDRYGRRGRAAGRARWCSGSARCASAFAGVGRPAHRDAGRSWASAARSSCRRRCRSSPTSSPPQERGRAIGVWAGTAGLGIALGPLAGGFLLEHFYWGSIFLGERARSS